MRLVERDRLFEPFLGLFEQEDVLGDLLQVGRAEPLFGQGESQLFFQEHMVEKFLHEGNTLFPDQGRDFRRDRVAG